MATNRLLELLDPVLRSLESQANHPQLGPCYSALVEIRTQRIADYQLRNASKAVEWLVTSGFYKNNLELGEQASFLRQFLDIAVQRAKEADQSNVQFVGRYMLLEEVGRGGAGIVYFGEAMDSGERVAVKLLHYTVTNDVGEKALRELLAGKQVQSPWCVKVNECFKSVQQQNWILVSEYVEGYDCTRWLNEIREKLQSKALPPQFTLLVLEQMCQGLAAAHNAGIIHQDIKPENFIVLKSVASTILGYIEREETDGLIEYLVESRSRAWIKLADFGLALARNVDISQSQSFFLSSLAENRRGGSLLYMPPEQIDGRGISRKTDVFPLGLIGYQILTNQPVLSARSHSENLTEEDLKDVNAVVAKIINAEQASTIASQTDPALANIPYPLADLLAQMTARQRDQRPGSSEVLATIQTFIDEPEVLNRAARPSPVLLAFISVLLVSIVAGAVYIPLKYFSKPVKKDPIPAQPIPDKPEIKPEIKPTKPIEKPGVDKPIVPTPDPNARQSAQFLTRADFPKLPDLTEADYGEQKRALNAVREGRLHYYPLLRQVSRSAVSRILRKEDSFDASFLLARSIEPGAFADTTPDNRIILTLDAISKFSDADLQQIQGAYLYALSMDALSEVNKPALQTINSLNCPVFFRNLRSVPKDCEKLLTFPGALHVELGLESVNRSIARALASVKNRKVILPNLQSIDSYCFEKLVQSCHSLHLNQIKKIPSIENFPINKLTAIELGSIQEISTAEAETLAKIAHKIQLPGLRKLDASAANTLVRTPILRLGLREIDEDVARELARFKGRELQLPQLYSLGQTEYLALTGNPAIHFAAHIELRRRSRPDTVDALARADNLLRQGLPVPTDVLRNLPILEPRVVSYLLTQSPSSLDLSACSEVSNEAWPYLRQFEGDLTLGLRNLNRTSIINLTGRACRQLILPALESVSPEDLSALLKHSKLARLSLPALREVNAQHLETLSRHCVCLHLDAVQTLTEDALTGLKTDKLKVISLRSLRELNDALAKKLASLEDIDVSGLRQLSLAHAKMLASDITQRKARIFLPPLSHCEKGAIKELARVTHTLICRPDDAGFIDQYEGLLSCHQVQLPNVDIGCRLAQVFTKAGRVKVLLANNYQTGQAAYMLGQSHQTIVSESQLMNSFFRVVKAAKTGNYNLEEPRKRRPISTQLVPEKLSAIPESKADLRVFKRNLLDQLFTLGHYQWLPCAPVVTRRNLRYAMKAGTEPLILDQVTDFSELSQLPKDKLRTPILSLGAVTALNTDVLSFLSKVQSQFVRLPALKTFTGKQMTPIAERYEQISLPALRKLNSAQAQALANAKRLRLDGLSLPDATVIKALCASRLESLCMGGVSELDSEQWRAFNCKVLELPGLVNFVDQIAPQPNKFTTLRLLNINDLTPELAKSLVASTENLVVPNVRKPSPEVLAELIKVRGELDLGLTWLDLKSAQILATFKGKRLNLSQIAAAPAQAILTLGKLSKKIPIVVPAQFQWAGLFYVSNPDALGPLSETQIRLTDKYRKTTVMDMGTATTLTQMVRCPPLPLVSSIEPAVLRQLAKGKTLNISLPTLTESQVSAISKGAPIRLELNGLEKLDATTLKLFSIDREFIALNGLSNCSPDYLKTVASSCEMLELNALTSLSVAQAESLSQSNLKSLNLSGIKSMTPIVAKNLRSIATLKLRRLENISRGLAKNLVDPTRPHSLLDIRNATTFAPGAIQELAKHRGTLVLPSLMAFTTEDLKTLSQCKGQLLFDYVCQPRKNNSRILKQFQAAHINLGSWSIDVDSETQNNLVNVQSELMFLPTILRLTISTQQQFKAIPFSRLKGYLEFIQTIKTQSNTLEINLRGVQSQQRSVVDLLERSYKDHVLAAATDLSAGSWQTMNANPEQITLLSADRIRPHNLALAMNISQRSLIYPGLLSENQHRALGTGRFSITFLATSVWPQFSKSRKLYYSGKLSFMFLLGLTKQTAKIIGAGRQKHIELNYPLFVSESAFEGFRQLNARLTLRLEHISRNRLQELIELNVRDLDLELNDVPAGAFATIPFQFSRTQKLRLKVGRQLSDPELEALVKFPFFLELTVSTLSPRAAEILAKRGKRTQINALEQLPAVCLSKLSEAGAKVIRVRR